MTFFSNTMRQWIVFSGICAVFMSLSPAHAQTSARESLNIFNQTVLQAKGTFIQTVISPNGRVKQEGTGRFAFAKPGQFRWETLTPFPQLIVSNGQSVVTFDPDLEQASRRPVADAMDSSPSALLFGSKDLDKLFKLADETQPVGGTQWLKATPIQPESLFSEIRVGMREGRPSEVEIYDSLGQVTRLRLQSWDVSPDFTAQTFQFELPEGVDLIEVQ